MKRVYTAAGFGVAGVAAIAFGLWAYGRQADYLNSIRAAGYMGVADSGSPSIGFLALAALGLVFAVIGVMGFLSAKANPITICPTCESSRQSESASQVVQDPKRRRLGFVLLAVASIAMIASIASALLSD